MSDTTRTPPGWYTAPDGSGRLQWWNGTAWTDHYAAPSEPAPYASAPSGSALSASSGSAAEERAPEGAPVHTVWIWLIVLLPLVGLIGVSLIDWPGYAALIVASPGDPLVVYRALLSPGYLVLLAIGWLCTAASILFAWLDWRRLLRAGVPRPFSWAWILLALAGVGSAVYSIGRSVVVRRRTGRGIAPMWVTIAVLAAGLLTGLGIAGLIVSAALGSAPGYTVD